MKLGPGLLAVFLCALSLAAQAEHHRGHAAGFLNDASDDLLLSQDAMAAYIFQYIPGSSINITEERTQKEIATIVRNLNTAANLIVEAQVYLATPTNESLDLARRSISRPAHEGERAALTEMWNAAYHINLLIYATPDTSPGNVNLLSSLSHMTLTWRKLDTAEWHIQDAIREEIYEDQVFICAGPNNHCP